jgi:hypothetical protein
MKTFGLGFASLLVIVQAYASNPPPKSQTTSDELTLDEVQPGSIYEQLGLKKGDVVKTSPNTLQMTNSLRTTSEDELQAERDGEDWQLDEEVNESQAQ